MIDCLCLHLHRHCRCVAGVTNVTRGCTVRRWSTVEILCHVCGHRHSRRLGTDLGRSLPHGALHVMAESQ